MPRRHDPALRCARCRVHLELCFCSSLPSLETRTRLVLLIHRLEARKTTNTGLLATYCLPNSEVVERGHEEGPSGPMVFPDGYDPVLLFPAEGAEPLTADLARGRPLALVVPDGTWRQAFKARQRVPGLSSLRCVALPLGAPSAYRLRVAAQPEGLSTIEAIARAMGVLEGEAVQRALEKAQRMLVERTLWTRGTIGDHQVTDGLPEGAMRGVRGASSG